MQSWLVIGLLGVDLLTTAPATNQSPPTAPVVANGSAAVLKQAARDFARLEEIAGLLAKQEQAATGSNDLAMAASIRQRCDTVVALKSAMEPVQARMQLLAKDGKLELLRQSLVEVSSARSRAEELLGVVPGPVAPVVSHDDQIRQADASLARLAGIVEELGRLEEQALASNQTARAECIRRQHSLAVGLLSAMRPVRERLPLLADEEGAEAFQEALGEVANAAKRGELLLAAVDGCRDGAPWPRGMSRRRWRQSAEPTDGLGPYSAPEGLATGPKGGCFRQERLACLLIQAMELQVDEPGTTVCTELLARRKIAPLNGWEATRCVSLDDFAVVVARAMNLPVGNPDDPASYVAALRADGLPVDILAPANAVPQNPDIAEAQARAFFASGYAGPFISTPIRP